MPVPPAMRSPPASTASRCTAPMAIWSTSSCAIPPICATTIMAGRSTTASASCREVLEAVGGEIGMDRVGIRFSPNIQVQGVEDSDPIALYAELAKTLEELKVPWIELREPDKPTSSGAVPTAPVSPAMRRIYSGVIVLNSDYDWTDARGRLDGGRRRCDQHRPAVHRQSRPGGAHRARCAAQPGRSGDLLLGWCPKATSIIRR